MGTKVTAKHEYLKSNVVATKKLPDSFVKVGEMISKQKRQLGSKYFGAEEEEVETPRVVIKKPVKKEGIFSRIVRGLGPFVWILALIVVLKWRKQITLRVIGTQS